jgi:hypothetical protein
MAWYLLCATFYLHLSTIHIVNNTTNNGNQLPDEGKIVSLKDLFTEGLFRKPEGTNYSRPLNEPCKQKAQQQNQDKTLDGASHHLKPNVQPSE